MTPAARVAAAIEVLDAWQAGVPVDQALTRWARGARYAGSGDRAAVRDHVFDALRCRGSAAALGRGDTGRALMIGLLRWQGVPPETMFTGAGHAPPPLNPEEAATPDIRPDPRRDIPDWTMPEFGALASERALFAAMQTRAPLYLRVNPAKASVETAAERLAAEGIGARACPGSPTALQVTGDARRVHLTAPYRDGLVEPQDLSVQRAMTAVPWPKAGTILDYCAGGGGKTLALADLSDARLFAHDAEPRRMRDLPVRADRAGVAVTLAETADLPGLGPFDAVLCDVPCSGSGTWRRDPEAKWRLTPARLAELVRSQTEIVAGAARLVRPGGLLVYMTCSLFEAENGSQIARFLARNPAWVPEGDGRDTPLTASDGFYHAWLRAPGG